MDLIAFKCKVCGRRWAPPIFAAMAILGEEIRDVGVDGCSADGPPPPFLGYTDDEIIQAIVDGESKR